MPRECAACGVWKVKADFSKSQWIKGDGLSRCLACVAKSTNKPRPPEEGSIHAERQWPSPTTLKMWHGTSWENAQRIMVDGFIESEDGCLGAGVYCAREEKALRFARDGSRHGGARGGLVELLITFNHPKYVSEEDRTWQAEGYDACRTDKTSVSTNMEWCVAHRSQLKVISIRPVTIGHDTSTGAPLEPTTSRSMPSKLRILFVEGFSQCDPDSFMAIALSGAPPLQWMRESGIPDMSEVATAAWHGAQLERVYCDNQAQAAACSRKIATGGFHAVVVADLSHDHRLFVKQLGTVLRQFAEAGGAVAFPTSEGLILSKTLKELFGTSWEPGGYCRTTFSIAQENQQCVAAMFGAGVLAGVPCNQFSAKACSLVNVPMHERCFVTNSESHTQSHVPFMAGQEVTSGEACVAVHKIGQGSVAYFGDVNCEIATVQLVASYVLSTAPSDSICVDGTMGESESTASSCSWCGDSPTKLLKCSRCKESQYCNQQCQRLDWKNGHKQLCGQNVQPVSGFTLGAIRSAIAAAPNGGMVVLRPGAYNGQGPLIIDKGITLKGAGKADSGGTTLNFQLVVAHNASGPGQVLELSSLRAVNGIVIQENEYRMLKLVDLHVTLPQGCSDDVLDIGNCKGEKVLVLDCEIFGGSDTVNNTGSSTKLHIKQSEIRFAQSRGIFSNRCFTIEDSEVSCCGGYGMKTRGGVIRKGDCDIQPGPWDQHNPYNVAATMQPFGYGEEDDGEDDEEDDEGCYGMFSGMNGIDGGMGGMCGFNDEEVMELLSQGVKPWDDDAHAVLAALNGDSDLDY